MCVICKVSIVIRLHAGHARHHTALSRHAAQKSLQRYDLLCKQPNKSLTLTILSPILPALFSFSPPFSSTFAFAPPTKSNSPGRKAQRSCYNKIMCAVYFFSFSRSRISERSSSCVGPAGAAGSAAASSSFFLVSFITPLRSMKIQKATMMKSRAVWMKLP